MSEQPSRMVRGLARAGDALSSGSRSLRDRVGLVRPPKVTTYRGYGTTSEVRMRGRVLEAFTAPAWPDSLEASRLDTLAATASRFLTAELGGVAVTGDIGDHGSHAESDPEGFVEVRVTGEFRPGWQVGRMQPNGGAEAEVRVLVPPTDAPYLVISDIDDTVLVTDVDQPIRMIARTLMSPPGRRRVIPGIAELYARLTGEATGPLRAPMFYLSSSPWNLHGLIDRILSQNDLPEGPLLLSDWGFTPEWAIRAPAMTHKLRHIEDLAATYPDLPIILIGDSGEHDPEVYAAAAERLGDRIAAILIRDMDDLLDRAGPTALARLDEVAVPSIAAKNLVEAATFLADLGLLTWPDVTAVRQASEPDDSRRVAP